MGGRKRRDIPTPLARGRDRFEAWRRARSGDSDSDDSGH